MLKRGDLALAIGVMPILVVLILPLPPMLLDLALALSITLSVLILMTALFIQTPLEFSAFPTVLLISTMLRLALNLASTRLILSHGHEGTAAAGHVIEAFGNFVMGGNFVIGVIVFAILVIVNFVVITKGSGRIAEVAARFTLDAMPGKQMAIDADLSAGLINEDEARAAPPRAGGRKRLLRRHGRRLEVRARRRHRRPADRVHQHHRRHHHRRRAAGHAVRRGRAHLHAADRRRRPGHADPGADRLDGGRPARLQGRRRGRGRQGADRAVLRLSQGARHVGRGDAGDGGVLPGIPAIPFLLLGGGAGALAWFVDKRQKQAAVDERQDRPKRCTPRRSRSRSRPRSRSTTSRSSSATPCCRWSTRPTAPTASPSRSRRCAARSRIEMGFVMPSVRILDNVQLDANTYVIKIKEVEAGNGRIWPGQLHGDGPDRRAGDAARRSTRRSRPSACPPPGSTPRSRKTPRSRATPWSTPPP